MNSVRSNNTSLKYQGFTPSGCKDIRFRNFVAKTQFLYNQKSGNFALARFEFRRAKNIYETIFSLNSGLQNKTDRTDSCNCTEQTFSKVRCFQFKGTVCKSDQKRISNL